MTSPKRFTLKLWHLTRYFVSARTKPINSTEWCASSAWDTCSEISSFTTVLENSNIIVVMDIPRAGNAWIVIYIIKRYQSLSTAPSAFVIYRAAFSSSSLWLWSVFDDNSKIPLAPLYAKSPQKSFVVVINNLGVTIPRIMVSIMNRRQSLPIVWLAFIMSV